MCKGKKKQNVGRMLLKQTGNVRGVLKNKSTFSYLAIDLMQVA